MSGARILAEAERIVVKHQYQLSRRQFRREFRQAFWAEFGHPRVWLAVPIVAALVFVGSAVMLAVS